MANASKPAHDRTDIANNEASGTTQVNLPEDTQGSAMILPGATIGMVGGGQLGRMFAMAAATMGYRVVVFSESADTPAAQVAHQSVVGHLDDVEAVKRFALQCDVITLEFENVPAATMELCNETAPTYPSANVLAVSQDRLIEKSTLRDAGLAVTPFAPVHDRDSLQEAAIKLGWPMVVKTTRDGYDGKGQYRVHSIEDASTVPWDSAAGWIAEQWMEFEKEVSVVVAVSATGESETYPVFENHHHNHILDVSIAPACVSDELAEKARQVATQAAKTLGLIGLMCVEFFVVDDDVIINEVAPRPHNSGHLTIEGSHTSQFEQHVRAVCGLPLGSTAMKCAYAAMANLLGDLWFDEQLNQVEPNWAGLMEDPSISLHLYGKAEPKVGRKMGHITVAGHHADEVRVRVSTGRDRLCFYTDSGAGTEKPSR